MQRTMWNAQMEAIAPPAQRVMEREKLARQLEYVYARSPFYQRKFQDVNLTPNDIRSPKDLSRLPFTNKPELSESQEREPPFGDYLAAPSESLSTIHRTSGSTGRFIYTVLTKNDMDQTTEVGARAFWAAGLRPHHTVVACMNYTLWMGGYTDHRNLERTGASVIPYGVGNSRRLVRVLQELKVDAIWSTPSYPNRLENVVREELGIEPAELNMKLGLFGGEPGLGVPSFKQRIEDTWGIRASNVYGLADSMCDLASVCDEAYELHFVGQGALLADIIDPSTGEDLPIEEGVSGELVLTNLDREAQPLIRYRTRDLIEIQGVGPCGCGRTGFRFMVAGRSDDMLHVKGINVFPSGIAEVLNTLIPEVTGEFQVVLSHPGPYDALDITVESGRGAGPDAEALARRVEGEIRQTLTFSAKVQLVPPGTIPLTEFGKMVRVAKKY
ncbi:MAG: phenylacetate--CoA ligase family protein [Chloroflexi bacterium]|nr:phenylacetate--CoA ligase family protein [Chloroflexota bacterium]